MPSYNNFDATLFITLIKNKGTSGEVGSGNTDANFNDPESDTPFKGIKIPKGLKKIIIKSVTTFNKRRRPLTN